MVRKWEVQVDRNFEKLVYLSRSLLLETERISKREGVRKALNK